MAWRYEIRLGGSGGQGVILMGIILAEAIGLYEGKYVTQIQSYGPEARGGSSKAEVVISDEEIDYPEAEHPDLLLAMNQKSCDDFFSDMKPGGLVIVDSTFVSQFPPVATFGIPFTRIARDKLHREVVANIAALGALTQLTPLVSPQAMREAIVNRTPRGTEKLNLAALSAGIQAAKKAIKQGPTRMIHGDIPRDGLLGYY
jgi:2-oxoglutarate ferredoxin oxidoreductase subunit gamma